MSKCLTMPNLTMVVIPCASFGKVGSLGANWKISDWRRNHRTDQSTAKKSTPDLASRKCIANTQKTKEAQNCRLDAIKKNRYSMLKLSKIIQTSVESGFKFSNSIIAGNCDKLALGIFNLKYYNYTSCIQVFEILVSPKEIHNIAWGNQPRSYRKFKKYFP